MIDAAIQGLEGILQWKAFGLMIVGILISSTLVAMPGIGSKTAIALLLPFAFVLDKYEAIALIVSVWAVSNTANSITAILFSVPGGGRLTSHHYGWLPHGKEWRGGACACCFIYLLSTWGRNWCNRALGCNSHPATAGLITGPSRIFYAGHDGCCDGGRTVWKGAT